MTTKPKEDTMTDRTITGRDLVAAIRAAFRGSDPCHCHTVSKLGEDELLENLTLQRLIGYEDRYGVGGMTIEMLLGDTLTRVSLHGLIQRFTFAVELTGLSFAELLQFPNLGSTQARAIERKLAQHGLLLKDGDPAVIDRVRAEEAEKARAAEAGAFAARDPDEARDQAFEALIDLGKTLLREGTVLTASAARMAVRKNGGRRSRRAELTLLARYAGEDRPFSGEVGRVIAPLIALDGTDVAKADLAPASEPDKVVTLRTA